jgi:hypothetical protein
VTTIYWIFVSGFGFESWNQVYFPTGAADFRCGANPKPVDGKYYQGHLQVANTLQQIAPKIQSATTLLVGGASGGGLSQVINVDYIASQFPPSCDVRAWINSGLHFDMASYPDFIAGKGKAAEKPLINKTVATIFNAFVDESCRAALGDDWYKCIGFDHAFPHISTPSFISQSQFDVHQLTKDFQLPANAMTPDTANWSNATKEYVAYFGRRSLEVFLPLMRNASLDKNAAFWMPSCNDHIKATRINAPETVTAADGQTMTVRDLFAAWWSGKLTQQAIVIDACEGSGTGLPCNKAASTTRAFSCVSPSPGPGPSCVSQLSKDGCSQKASTPAQCIACAKQHETDLEAAGCTKSVVKTACDKL